MFSLQLLGLVQKACTTPVLNVTGNIMEWTGRGTCVLATPVQNKGVPPILPASVKIHFHLQGSKMSPRGGNPCLAVVKTRE